MMYTHDISRAFETAIGKDGADKAYFDTVLHETESVIATLRARKEDNSWPILNIAEATADLSAIEKTAQRIKDHARALVVIGMGGSSLGGKTLVSLAANPFGRGEKDTAVYFMDNIDPHTTQQLLATLDLKATIFLVVSKSGSTAETLALMLIMMEAVEKKLGLAALRGHFIAITEPGKNVLRAIADKHAMTVLDHDPHIGGRFAVLTSVGLLPALVAGLDIHAVRRGAASVVRDTLAVKASPAAQGAALHLALLERGKTISVMMPYCDRLDLFNTWYRQIWAESLGKNGKGTTPLRSLGTSDQHSQLQLYIDGPRDKLVTIIGVNQQKHGPAIPTSTEASLAYLGGHTIGDLMDAEQRATAESLTRNRIPLRVITLPTLGAEGIGALMMHFMLETMIVAQLLNVNAFDQPAVEEGKRLAKEYLSKI